MFKLLYFVFFLAKPPVIKIGVHLPLSGPIAEYGIHCLEGVKLAFANHPEIRLIIRDNEGKVENIPIILRELVEEEGIIAVIGPIISPNAVIAGLEATKFGIPIILPAATNTAVTKVSNYLFRTCYTDEQQAKAIANFTYHILGKKEVHIIVDTSNIYSGGLALYFKSEIEHAGGITHLFEWDGASDLTETLTNNSTVFLPLYYKSAADIVKKARKEKLNITFIGADGLDTPELFKAMANDTQKLYFSTHYFEGGTTDFTELYKKAYGGEPNAFSALGFDAARLIISAIEKAKDFTPSQVLHSLLNIESFQGVTGNFQYNGKRDPIKTIFIVQLQNGKPSLLQKL